MISRQWSAAPPGRNRMRGFLFAPILPYLVAGLAVLAILAGTYYKGRAAGVEATEKRLQPLLTACTGQVAALGRQIEAQNVAVAALEAAGKARQARATSGMAAARSDALKAQNEAARLLEAALSPLAPNQLGTCPAGEAVLEVRRGLTDNR